MTAVDQVPDIQARDDALMKAISRHEVKREKLRELQKRVDRMIDYRTRRIRELGSKRRVELTFRLPGIE